MSFEFKRVAEYRENYKVLAKFYDTKNGNMARLFADIVKIDCYEDPIDAYIIMINPGSCRIKEKNKIEPNSYDYYRGKDVVEAVSDPAQKCVMAFMDLCNLNKVRILNLIDIKDGNFSNLKKKVEEIKEEMSLFSPQREECRKEIMSEKAVIIAAWGTDKRFSKLKIQALNCLKDKPIGVPPNVIKNDYDYKYIKPPKKDAQIEVIEQLVDCYKNYITDRV